MNPAFHRENLVDLRKIGGRIAAYWQHKILGIGTLYHGAAFDRGLQLGIEARAIAAAVLDHLRGDPVRMRDAQPGRTRTVADHEGDGAAQLSFALRVQECMQIAPAARDENGNARNRSHRALLRGRAAVTG